jgi:hypothetical protein
MSLSQKEEWVIWNGSLGVLDMASIGRIEEGEGGRSAFIAAPYGAVGPFSLDELEAQGRIAFGACLVMSRQRWQEDQVQLRREAQEKRRQLAMRRSFDDRPHREALGLPMEGPLGAAAVQRRLPPPRQDRASRRWRQQRGVPPHRRRPRRPDRAPRSRLSRMARPSTAPAIRA